MFGGVAVGCAFLIHSCLDAIELVELSADEHTPDLACARADLVELGIAQQPASGIIIDVTIATY